MIRRREEHYESKTGHERWLVSYADFITLLFGFFVVMYSVSQVSEQKYRVLSDTLASVFEGNSALPVDSDEMLDQYPLDQQGKISGLSPQVNLVDTEILAKELEDALVHLVDPKQVSITATEDWVQIDLNANLLFTSGSADPSDQARNIFRDIAAKLAPYDNQIEVSGHTDNVPIRTAKFQSNWELSAARASSVVRLLADNGVKPEQLSAVGNGEFRPIADNATEEGRSANRRVVLMVARHAVERPVVTPDVITQPGESNPIRPPMLPDSALPEQKLPDQSEVTPPGNIPIADPAFQPVRLKDGGLLFTADPEKPAE
jgi:chemotaxis protein MotB